MRLISGLGRMRAKQRLHYLDGAFERVTGNLLACLHMRGREGCGWWAGRDKMLAQHKNDKTSLRCFEDLPDRLNATSLEVT